MVKCHGPLRALRGITRSVVFEIAAELGVKVRETDITRHDVFVADECFLTGTAAEIGQEDRRVIAFANVTQHLSQLDLAVSETFNSNISRTFLRQSGFAQFLTKIGVPVSCVT